MEKPVSEQSQWVDPAESAEKEIKEIETILPEIKEKVGDYSTCYISKDWWLSFGNVLPSVAVQ